MSQNETKFVLKIPKMHEIAPFKKKKKKNSREHTADPTGTASRLWNSILLLRSSISLLQSKQNGYASAFLAHLSTKCSE